MSRATRHKELYKCTMQQKAIQDMLLAYSQEVETLQLGPRMKLGDRGNNILLDLIRSKKLKEVVFADCKLKQEDLLQIKQVLTDKSTSLCFRNNLTIGVEGCSLIRALLRKKSVKSFSAWDCGLSVTQLTILVESLSKMSGEVLDEVNFRGTNLGYDGSILLKRLLAVKQVKKLDVGHCLLAQSHLNSLVEGLSEMQGTMDSISLKGNIISRNDVENFKSQTENKVIEVLFY